MQTARTTSLTVVPVAFLSRFTSSRPMAVSATLLRLVRAALNEVRGADKGRAALPGAVRTGQNRAEPGGH